MGIRGLTTYVDQSKVSFDPYRLRNCHLVIDGNSVAAQLYCREFGRSKIGHCAFGGDYDEYARSVKRFFCQLACCLVKPIVVFDGGKEPRKLATSLSRLKGNIAVTGKITPYNCLNCPLPLLMLEVFRWVASRSGATVAQCEFEADEEIAALSRALCCPLLSFDSDFYIHAVPCYIPFPTLATELTEETHESSQENSSGKYVERYIECSAFNVEKFLNRTDIGDWRMKSGGSKKILQVEVLPLVAALLGNDYIKPQTFRHFFSQIQLPKKHSKSFQQRRIVGLLEWLRLEKSLDSAINKILNHTKKGQREHLEKIIRQTVEVYVGCPSELFYRLKLSSSLTPSTSSVNVIDGSGQTTSLCSESKSRNSVMESINQSEFLDGTEKSVNFKCKDFSVNDSVDLDSKSIQEDDCCSSCESLSTSENNDIDEFELDAEWRERCKQLPSWFQERYQCCDLPPSFMDIMMRRTYLCPPQVEDQSRPHSHAISFPILSAILRILTPDNNHPLVCLTRVDRHAANLYLDPRPPQISWPAPEFLLSESPSKRLDMLLQALNLVNESERENTVRNMTLNSLPSDWRLLGLCLAYWRLFSQQILDERYLIAACFCIVVLKVIDVRAGPPGRKSRKARKEKSKKNSKQNLQLEGVKLDDNERKCGSSVKIAAFDDKNDDLKDDYDDLKDDYSAKIINHKSANSFSLTPEDCKQLEVVRPNVKQLLQVVSTDECVQVSGYDGQIFQMRQIDGVAKQNIFDNSRYTKCRRPCPFNVSTVHVFAELQSVLLHANHLNSLLGEPLFPSALHTSFSGTLSYNAHYRTHGKTGKGIWQSLLGMSAPSLENLMDEFYNSVFKLAWGKDLKEQTALKKNSKRKRNRKSVDNGGALKENDHKTESCNNEDDLFDAENKFSLLGLID